MIEILGISILGLIVIYAIWYYYNKKVKSEINEYLYDLFPNLFPTVGMLFTFIGIFYGLWNFDSNNIEGSIPQLLDGLKVAFFVSMGGILLLLIFSVIHAWRKNNINYQSDETVAINELRERCDKLSLEIINNQLSVKLAMLSFEKNIISTNSANTNLLIEEIKALRSDFSSTDESDNILKAGNLLRDLYKQSEKQAEALESFSGELGENINLGFQRILNDPSEGVVKELKQVKEEIINLADKLKDPATDMTQNIVKDLQESMSKMVEEFKTSVSGDTKSEMEQLAKVLSQAGNSLTNFPATMQTLTDNLNENFRGIQDVVSSISSNTLSQSEQSISDMREQVENMAEILKGRVGDLQVGQQTLINEQSKNLEISDALLNAFNVSVDKMNVLAVGINQNIEKINSSHLGLENVVDSFRIASADIGGSTSNLSSLQSSLKLYSKEVLEKNEQSLIVLNNSLDKANEVSENYVNRFDTIETGLQGIFSEITKGLNDYQVAVGSSLEDYLGKYTEALNKTASSLAQAASQQSEIIEELSEQLSKFNNNK